MRVLCPTGIGDSVWALHKVQSIRDVLAPGEPIHVSLVGDNKGIDTRALDFVKRFRFVSTVDMKPFSIQAYGPLTHPDGTYNYIEDGKYTFNDEEYVVLVPNRVLEQGIRLEDWLPHYEINWDIFRDFYIDIAEKVYASDLHQQVGDYAVFYPGPLTGNTVEGHNRGPIWKPEDWKELGRKVHDELGLNIIVVGATYDASYYGQILKPVLGDDETFWHNQIGKTNLGRLWAITNRAKFVVSYQAGVGIISTYLGTPTAIFWRPNGDSISRYTYLSFSDKMASAWVPPTILEAGKHLPLYYGKDSVESILTEVRQRGWHETPARHVAIPAR